MADSNAFACACEALEELTEFDRLAARGTVRLALKESGLDPASVTRAELTVVVRAVLPGELSTRGIADPERVCEQLRAKLRGVEDSRSEDTPDAIFARLAR